MFGDAMLGFVSALSASVAVMVLLMSVLLANVLSTALEMGKNKNKATLEGIESNYVAKEDNIMAGSMMQSLIFNNEVLNVIDSKKVKSLAIYCSYGNNITQDAAMTYTVYNTVLLKRNIPEIIIDAQKPIKDTVGLNTCFFKSNNDERN